MIGHTFTSSGAVCLAFTQARRVGDYVLLASVDGQYAVATIDDKRIVEADGAPRSWLHADYYPSLREAAEAYSEETYGGWTDAIARAERVEKMLTERAAASTAATA